MSSRNRIAWVVAWNRSHNNSRFEELIPRLTNVDRFVIDMHPWWPLRGLRRRIELPLRSIWLGLTYPLMFAHDWRMVRLYHSPCVLDHDDPFFTPDELAALASQKIRLLVVTSEAVKAHLLELGIHTPMEVIPHGILLPRVDPNRVRAIRGQWAGGVDNLVVGIHQPHFEFAEELGGDPIQRMYAVDDMFAVMESAHRSEPKLELWLVGEPSKRVAEYAHTRSWIKLLGYHPRSELLGYVSAFNIGLYPRRVDVGGRSSLKILEYMACGIPVAGFQGGEMQFAENAQAGISAKNPADLSAVILRLAKDSELRIRLGNQGQKESKKFDWELLAARYREILDTTVSKELSRSSH